MSQLQSITVALHPFKWRGPRIERCVCETVVRIGPLTISWDAAGLPAKVVFY